MPRKALESKHGFPIRYESCIVVCVESKYEDNSLDTKYQDIVE